MNEYKSELSSNNLVVDLELKYNELNTKYTDLLNSNNDNSKLLDIIKDYDTRYDEKSLYDELKNVIKNND